MSYLKQGYISRAIASGTSAGIIIASLGMPLAMGGQKPGVTKQNSDIYTNNLPSNYEPQAVVLTPSLDHLELAPTKESKEINLTFKKSNKKTKFTFESYNYIRSV